MTVFFKKNKNFLIVMGIILVGLLIVYGKFVFFHKLYIFNDTGSDTFDTYWPFIYDLALKIKQGQLPFWSHNMGMGNNYYAAQIFIGDIFVYLYTLVNQDKISYAFGLMAVLKMLVAGGCIYKYSRYIKLSFVPALIITLLYVFNGYFVLWGQHYQFVNIMVFAPLLLLGFERLMKESKWGLFSISVMLIAISSYYFLYVISIFLLIYAVMRYLLENEFSLKSFMQLIFKSALSYSVGIALAAFLFLPTVHYLLNSPRITGKLEVDLFQLADIKYYLSMVLRMMNNNSLGIGNDFYGFINYYEDPILYSGIICLIMLPQIFFNKPKKEKVVYGVVYIILLTFVLLPYFSLFFNAFSKIDYRWMFGVIIFNILVLGQVLQNWIDDNYKIHLKSLVSTLLAVAVLTGIAPFIGGKIEFLSSEQMVNSYKVVFIGLIFACCYVLLFWITQRTKRMRTKVYLSGGIVFLIFIEVISNSYPTVNNRLLLDPDYIKNKQGYYDATQEVVQQLKNEDPGFYRINKAYNSRFFNDALIQKFNGIKEYNSIIQPSIINFYQKMNVSIGGNNSLLGGLDNRVKLETLLNTKYYLALENEAPYGFKLLHENKGVYTFKNEYALPFGYAYDQYITEEDFEKLNSMQKEDALFKAFVVSDEEGLNLSSFKQLATDQISKIPEEIIDISSQLKTENAILSENQSSFLIDLDTVVNGELTLSYQLKTEERAESKLFWSSNKDDFADNNFKVIDSPTNEGVYTVSLGFVNNVSSLKLTINNLDNNQIANAVVKIKPVSYNENDIRKLASNSFNATLIDNNNIKGSIMLDSSQMIFFSIPFDTGWTAKVDGIKQNVYQLNYGFLGVTVDEGQHLIELNYEPPMFKLGLAVSMTTVIAILLILLLRRCRKRSLN
ncbi:YfhO family protein [Paenibacillus sp. KS-LC4]|uniref:YfhO family protein n=1 Tax=Paenibacillus sp. KS-LC4 TaxID=2979727 RepID=UPI0030CAF9DC